MPEESSDDDDDDVDDKEVAMTTTSTRGILHGQQTQLSDLPTRSQLSRHFRELSSSPTRCPGQPRRPPTAYRATSPRGGEVDESF